MSLETVPEPGEILEIYQCDSCGTEFYPYSSAWGMKDAANQCPDCGKFGKKSSDVMVRISRADLEQFRPKVRKK